MLCGGPVFFHFPPCPSPAPDKSPKHRLLHIFVFSMVGAFIILGVCIATCYYCINKSRGDARQGQENSPSPGETFQRMSYAELYVATDSFSMENLVGRGSFGSVYKGTFSFGTAAVKVLDVHRRGATRSFISECSALKRIRHRKLVKVITVCDSLDNNGNEFKALVLQFISNGSLDEWIYPSTENEFRTLSLMQRLNILLDVAEALEYLHHHINPPIVHCDVKPSNILLDATMVAHVSDLGIAKIMKAEESEQSVGQQCSSVGIKGTIGYLAPGMQLPFNLSCFIVPPNEQEPFIFVHPKVYNILY
uniref:Uncharacterized protein n=1 Tax=Avena sativa TaxID=4498 RepID=A0ACD6A6A0_AVESA